MATSRQHVETVESRVDRACRSPHMEMPSTSPDSSILHGYHTRDDRLAAKVDVWSLSQRFRQMKHGGVGDTGR